MGSYTPSVIETFSILLAIILMRYFVVSAAFYFATTLVFKKRWQKRRLHHEIISRKQIVTEIGWSMLSCLIFAGAGTLGRTLWAQGYTKVYLDVSTYGWIYFFASLPLLLFVHDTYFYFTHRLMHLPRLFRVIHKAHHESRHPSPFSSFSFHPIEAVIEALILPILVTVIPTHPAILLAFLTIMSIFGVVNHTGYEIYSQAFVSNRWLRHWLTTTHHEMHHSHYRTNYSLYFTFWDRWLNTEHPDYETTFFAFTERLKLPTSVGAVFHGTPSQSKSY